MKPVLKGILGLFLSLAMGSPLHSLAQTNPDDILGIWLTEKKDGKVEIYKVGSFYYGKIVWMKEPNDEQGKPQVDKNNEVANLRTRPILGMVIMTKMKWDGKGKWEEGNVYDPNNGKTYSGFVKMRNRFTLEMTGYVGFTFLSRSETWVRVK